MGLFDDYLYYYRFGEGRRCCYKPPPPPTSICRVSLNAYPHSPLVGELVGLTHRDLEEQIRLAVPSPCHRFLYVVRFEEVDHARTRVLAIEKLRMDTLEPATVYRAVGYEQGTTAGAREFISKRIFPHTRWFSFLGDRRTLLTLPIEMLRGDGRGLIRTTVVYEVEFNEADCTAVLKKFHFPPLPPNPDPDAYDYLAQIGFYSPDRTLRGGLFYHLDQTFCLFVLHTPRPVDEGPGAVSGGQWEEWGVDEKTSELEVGIPHLTNKGISRTYFLGGLIVKDFGTIFEMLAAEHFVGIYVMRLQPASCRYAFRRRITLREDHSIYSNDDGSVFGIAHRGPDCIELVHHSTSPVPLVQLSAQRIVETLTALPSSSSASAMKEDFEGEEHCDHGGRDCSDVCPKNHTLQHRHPSTVKRLFTRMEILTLCTRASSRCW